MNIAVKFAQVANQYNSNTALAFLSAGRYQTISYWQLEQYRLKLAVFLRNIGAEKGDKIAVMLTNSPQWIMSDLAAATLGLVVVPIHTTFNAEYISRIVEHSGSKFLIIYKEYFDKYKEVINKLPLQKVILVGGQINDESNKTLIWPDLDHVSETNIKAEQILPDAVHTIVYTSGTTGDPKAVMLTHHNIISDVESAKRVIPIYPTDRFFSFLPLSHAFERTAGYYVPLSAGASIFFARSSKTIIEDIRRARPTILSSVPRIFEKIYGTIFDKVEAGSNSKKKLFFNSLQLAVAKRARKLNRWGMIKWSFLDLIVLRKIRAIFGAKLRLAISGGASLDTKIIRFFDDLGIIILEGYGMTETSPIISVNHQGFRRFGTVGQAIDCNQVKISVDKEILVKGENVMAGYYKNETQTAEIIDAEGWLHTGDLGFMDKEGFITIIGRAKDVIVLSTGKNIFPEPIENTLNESRYISQSMVYGDRDKHISALIVPNFEQLKIWCRKNNVAFNLGEQKILDFYQEKINEKITHLSEVEQISNFKLLAEEFTQENGSLTPTLKLRRNRVLERIKYI
ncbi:MAG: hypothetical protein C3F02_00430 [Parcubacteria group bacterium]|nr:MAG: hypothetical protein C3F02_00430 [Parcubacteria group bacterium]